MVMNNEMESLDINTPFEFAFADGEYVYVERRIKKEFILLPSTF